MTVRMIILFIVLFIKFGFATSLIVSPMEIGFESQPGEESTKAVTIINSSMEDTVSIKVYFEDKTLIKDKSEGYMERICNDWLFISPQTLTLKPQESKSIRIDINIPDNKELSGDFWARFFIEQTSNLQHKLIESPTGARFKVNVVTRWAVNITESIPGTKNPNLKLISLNVMNEDSLDTQSSLITEFKVENSGNAIINVGGNIIYRDVDGNDVIKDAIKNFTIYPKDITIKSIPIPNGLDKGEYSVLTILDFGGEELIGGEFIFNIE